MEVLVYFKAIGVFTQFGFFGGGVVKPPFSVLKHKMTAQ